MDAVRRRSAAVPAVIALFVALGLLALFTHSSPHSVNNRLDSVGSSLHGCTSKIEPAAKATETVRVESGIAVENPLVTAPTGKTVGSAVGHQPHPIPASCLAVLIAIAVGVLLGLALRARPPRRWIMPASSTGRLFRPRTADCFAAGRLALCSRLLL